MLVGQVQVQVNKIQCKNKWHLAGQQDSRWNNLSGGGWQGSELNFLSGVGQRDSEQNYLTRAGKKKLRTKLPESACQHEFQSNYLTDAGQQDWELKYSTWYVQFDKFQKMKESLWRRGAKIRPKILDRCLSIRLRTYLTNICRSQDSELSKLPGVGR